MTAVGQHSMIGGPNCTNSTIATVMCPCAAAVGAMVLVTKGSDSRTRPNSLIASFKSRCSQSSPKPRAPSQFLFSKSVFFNRCRPSGVHTINLCFFISSTNIVFIQSLLSHAFTVGVVIFTAFKDGTVALLFGHISKRPWLCHVLLFLCLYHTSFDAMAPP